MPGCDIVIPIWNQHEVTKECIDSIERNTSYPYRLILVDNGSRKPAAEYIDSLKKSRPGLVTVIRNKENEGFIKAVNKGISGCTADYVCILNNDTVVCRGWLSEMVSVMNKDPRIGIVNPSSNNLGQRPPRGVSPEEYALKLEKGKGGYIDLGSALGFCMLVRRSMFTEIGLFDEVFGMGNFEDTDFSYRARQKNYLPVRALGAYVFHKENRSFNLLKRYKRDFEKNKKVFESRWGRPERILFVFPDRSPGEVALGLIGEALKKNNWVYVATVKDADFRARHSHIKVYKWSGLFRLRVLLKILFKKKRFDKIYCDDTLLINFIRLFKPLHKAAVS